ncbi:MAG: hypothetical protein AB7F98_03785 [Novosphingobium sp.]
MTAMTRRPPMPQSRGMLSREHSHTAWVTSDLDRALEVFAKRYGIGECSFLEGKNPQGGDIRVAFAWAGGQVLEIIQASGPGFAFYNQLLPQGEFAIRFHHLGFIVHDEADWNLLEQDISAGGWKVELETLTGDFIDAYYIDAPELGHYLEYVRLFEAGIAFYDAVPQN